jgi:hypothetical protein
LSAGQPAIRAATLEKSARKRNCSNSRAAISPRSESTRPE